jgi:hypothetical protein
MKGMAKTKFLDRLFLRDPDDAVDEKQIEKLWTKKQKRSRVGGCIVDKELPKSLVIIGAMCSGMTVLVDYLKYNKQEYFTHVLLHTFKRDFLK